MTRQEVISNYGWLQLGHAAEEDSVHRYAFSGTADDGAEVRLYHSPNVSVWEEYVRDNRPVCINESQDYRRVEVRRAGQLEFEEWQAYVF